MYANFHKKFPGFDLVWYHGLTFIYKTWQASLFEEGASECMAKLSNPWYSPSESPLYRSGKALVSSMIEHGYINCEDIVAAQISSHPEKLINDCLWFEWAGDYFVNTFVADVLTKIKSLPSWRDTTLDIDKILTDRRTEMRYDFLAGSMPKCPSNMRIIIE